MAKKNKEVEVIEPQVETSVMSEPKPTQRKKERKQPKDKFYYITGNRAPLRLRIPSRGIMVYDEDLGYEREIQYTVNQKTIFVDEFKGKVRPANIFFDNGALHVSSRYQTLQRFLEIHPHNGVLFKERDEQVIAMSELNLIELEIEALNAAQNMDVDTAEAIMRVEVGSKVSKMTSRELKRDLLVYAKRNPSLFLELASDDNVVLRNFGIRATEMGIIKLSSDQRTFNWGSNDRKLVTVPFDEHPYSALAAWFKTDEGMEIYSNIEKRLN